jgi:hypothetical protein
MYIGLFIAKISFGQHMFWEKKQKASSGVCAMKDERLGTK